MIQEKVLYTHTQERQVPERIKSTKYIDTEKSRAQRKKF